MSTFSEGAGRKRNEKSIKSQSTTIDSTPKINFEEEVTLLFYNSILEDLIEDVEELSDITKPCEVHEQYTKINSRRNISEFSTKDESISLFRKSSIDNDEELQNVIGYENSTQDDEVSVRDSIQTSRSSVYRDSLSFSARNLFGSKSTRQSLINSDLNIEDTTNWTVFPKTAFMKIELTNGNVYEGATYKMLMHGKGLFRWVDGTYYEGDFKNGQITGTGKMVYPDMTYYEGDFCKGYFHGLGMLNIVRTAMIYKGEWRQGMKHGKGWMYYGKMNWYDGGWYKDQRNGIGLRQYPDGSIYNGYWSNGKQCGKGLMYWNNRDFYKGTWKNGTMDGEGTYIWKINVDHDFSCTNNPTYKGSWTNGLRNGKGDMRFGMRNNSRLVGLWKNNMKHGPGKFSCNGFIVHKNPLFRNDKPIHMDTEIGANHPSRNDYQILPGQKDVKILCSPIQLRNQLGIIQANFAYIYEKALKQFHLLMGEKSIGLQYTVDSLTASQNLSLNSSKMNDLTESTISKTAKTFSFVKSEDSRNYRLYISLRDTEEKILHKCLRNSVTDLSKLFYKYYTICEKQKKYYIKNVPNSGKMLLRLMQWIFYMDIGIPQRYFSLIDIDNMIADNPQACGTSKHNPFECIPFYNFVTTIIQVAWKLYTEFLIIEDLHQQKGMVAFVLKKFKLDFLSNFETFNSFDINQYTDLLPLKQVYLLYKDIGEPHTARDFLRRCCLRKVEYKCTIDDLENNKPLNIHRGENSFAYNFCSFINPPQIGKKHEDVIFVTNEEDPYFKDLLVFRKLGSKTILKLMVKVCPLILTDNKITYMDYPLTFIEFYQILILCAKKLIELKSKEEEEADYITQETVVMPTSFKKTRKKKVK